MRIICLGGGAAGRQFAIANQGAAAVTGREPADAVFSDTKLSDFCTADPDALIPIPTRRRQQRAGGGQTRLSIS
ncbi:hypothetical protein GALL_140180 [mine drainage metagenome]|uniref:Uncharacterized protein n=1 Tax=mine drainage metagenome TaxID=410659 RepID=A0A1J5SI64_9ZZZZ